MDVILITLQRQTPDIFDFHEANFSILDNTQIIGYSIERNNLSFLNNKATPPFAVDGSSMKT